MELLRLLCWQLYQVLMALRSQAVLQPVVDVDGIGYVIAIRPCLCGKEGCEHDRKYQAFRAFVMEHYGQEMLLAEEASKEQPQSKVN